MNVSQVVVPFSFLFAFRAAGTIYPFRPHNWRQIAIALADPGIRSSLGGWSTTLPQLNTQAQGFGSTPMRSLTA